MWLVVGAICKVAAKLFFEISVVLIFLTNDSRTQFSIKAHTTQMLDNAVLPTRAVINLSVC